MSTTTEWPAPICNYYGRPTLHRRGDAWVLALDNYTGENTVEVSEAFAQAWIAQFPPPAPVTCWDCEGTGRWEPAAGWPQGCECMTCDGRGTVVPDDEG